MTTRKPSRKPQPTVGMQDEIGAELTGMSDLALSEAFAHAAEQARTNRGFRAEMHAEARENFYRELIRRGLMVASA